MSKDPVKIGFKIAAYILLFLSLQSFAADPLPDIKISGQDEWVKVTSSDIFNVSVALDAGDMAGKDVELWLLAGTSNGKFSFIPGVGWIQDIRPSWQGKLFSFDPFNVWINYAPFGSGEYWLGFAVDDKVDGLLDPTWVDLAALEVHPSSEWQTVLEQPFDQTAIEIIQEKDGGFLIIGIPTEDIVDARDPNADLYMLKTDSQGKILWSKSVKLPGQKMVTSVKHTNDGGFIVAGNQNSQDRIDTYLAKLDSEGALVWNKIIESTGWSWTSSVRQALDGGYVIGGMQATENNDTDLQMIKTDPTGNLTWKKSFGGCCFELLDSLETTEDGGYILIGNSESFSSGDRDIYLVRTDSFGNVLWENTYGGTGTENGRAIQQTSDGGFIMTGNTTSDLNFSGFSSGIYLAKMTSEGTIEWEQTYAGQNLDTGTSLRQTTEGGYLVAGQSSSFGAGDGDVILFKTNDTGEILWAKAFGGVTNNEATSVIETADGGYAIIGRTASEDQSDRDIYLIKVDVTL